MEKWVCKTYPQAVIAMVRSGLCFENPVVLGNYKLMLSQYQLAIQTDCFTVTMTWVIITYHSANK